MQMSTHRILVLNGANMNTLGKRDTGALGAVTLSSIMEDLTGYGASRDTEITCVQSNSECELIELIQRAEETYEGIIFNPGSFVHYSIGLREALDGSPLPCVEVHLANFFRKPENKSVLAASCRAVVCGFGPASYKAALDGLLYILK